MFVCDSGAWDTNLLDSSAILAKNLRSEFCGKLRPQSGEVELAESVGPERRQVQNASTLSRRDLMQRAMLVAIASGAVTAGCSVGGGNQGPVSEADLQALTIVSDLMIPATDTPGAVEAEVPAVIALLMQDIYAPQARGRIERALRTLPKLTDRDGALLADAAEILAQYDAEAFGAKPNYPYRALKRLVFDTYFTSELGGTQALLYDPFPGEYRGCIPYSDVGGTWL